MVEKVEKVKYDNKRLTQKYKKGKPESSLETLVKLHTSAIIIQERWWEYVLRKNNSDDFVPRFDTLKRSVDKTPKSSDPVPLLDLSGVRNQANIDNKNTKSKTIFDKDGINLSPKRIQSLI